MKIDYLEWDSAFFGIRVGIVKNPDTINPDPSLLNPFDVIYFFIDPGREDLSALLKQNGAFLADEKIFFTKKIDVSREKVPLDIYYYTGTETDEQVILTGMQSGVYSRFSTDTNFPPGAYEKLYREWMVKSISREIAKEVFVSREQDRIKGVVTIGENQNRAEIGIIAVDQQFRGQKTGRHLLHQCETWCIQNKTEDLRVVTQMANHGACNFYTTSGFNKEKVINVYHLWPHISK